MALGNSDLYAKHFGDPMLTPFEEASFETIVREDYCNIILSYTTSHLIVVLYVIGSLFCITYGGTMERCPLSLLFEIARGLVAVYPKLGKSCAALATECGRSYQGQDDVLSDLSP